MTTPTPSPSPPRINTRLMALRALGRILLEGEQLETSIASDPLYNKLEVRDRAFVRLLVSSVFRHKGQIDKVLGGYIKQTPPDFIMNALRLGAAQILVLKTSDHAAVSEMVQIVKQEKQYTKFSGFVNAVLRNLTREGGPKMAAIPPRENIPRWIYQSWEKAFGAGAARAMALQYMKPPPLDITVKSDPECWAEKLGGEVMFGQTIRLPKAGQISELPGYDTGDWWIQDLASSLPVQILQEVKGDLTGLRVLDLCAAPGGKTLQFAAAGASVTALDKSGHRLTILKENLARTNLEAEIVEADGMNWENEGEPFDVVLLDAPCSATGTYRRHPDVLHSKSFRQVADLLKVQKRLLAAASRHIRPGGHLIYCTCSLQTEEGEQQARNFAQKYEDFEVIKSPNKTWSEVITPEGYFRLLPHRLREKGGLDGFFFAMFSPALKTP